MRSFYNKVVKDTDGRIERSLRTQIKDKAHPNFGGFMDQFGNVEPKFVIYRTTTMIAGYFCKDSAYFGDDSVKEAILDGLTYSRKYQRPNGFFDLINCNFFSGPDTAFCLKRLIPYYAYLLKHNNDDIYSPSMKDFADEVIERVREILSDGAQAMKRGGFHTPNHRWAIASVLYMCSDLFNDSEMRTSADKYLAEGIDCNEDGEYAERSAGNYNRICNDAMIMLYNATHDKYYIDCAERNLNMMLNYIEPDSSIFTNNSTRQDRGVKVYPKDYYFEYLYLGDLLNNKAFLATANRIEDICAEKQTRTMDCLIHFMNLPHLIDVECEDRSIPTSYTKHFKDSQLVRVRKDDHSYSLVGNCSSFLYFTHGDLTMSMRIGASFCEHRAFKSETLTDEKNGYRMQQTMRGWYYLPFEQKQDTTDWWKMNNASRDKLTGPDLDFDVQITDAADGDGIDVHIKADGIDRAPLRIEMAFDSGTAVRADSFTLEGQAGGYVVAKEGTVNVFKGDNGISVGPAFGAHDFAAGKFGSEARDPRCFTVIFTDITCFEHTIKVRSIYNDRL